MGGSKWNRFSKGISIKSRGYLLLGICKKSRAKVGRIFGAEESVSNSSVDFHEDGVSMGLMFAREEKCGSHNNWIWNMQIPCGRPIHIAHGPLQHFYYSFLFSKSSSQQLGGRMTPKWCGKCMGLPKLSAFNRNRATIYLSKQELSRTISDTEIVLRRNELLKV